MATQGEDLRQLIEERLKASRDKIAAEAEMATAAERDARDAKKTRVGSENAPRPGRKAPPDGGYPRVSSDEHTKAAAPITAEDLRKTAEDLKVSCEAELDDPDNVVKVATDLAIEAAILDAKEDRNKIKSLLIKEGGTPAQTRDVPAVKTAGIRDVWQAARGGASDLLALTGLKQSNKSRLPGVSGPTGQQLRQDLPEVQAAAMDAAVEAVKQRFPEYANQAIDQAESGLAGVLRNRGARPVARNVLAATGVAGALAGAGYAGHQAGRETGYQEGVATEQLKDPQQIRSAYTAGAQRGAHGVLQRLAAHRRAMGGQPKMAASKAEALKDFASRVAGGKKSNKGRIAAAVAGGGAVAGGSAYAGHQTGYQQGVTEEQRKDPYQIRSAYVLGAQRGAHNILQQLAARHQSKQAAEQGKTAFLGRLLGRKKAPGWRDAVANLGPDADKARFGLESAVPEIGSYIDKSPRIQQGIMRGTGLASVPGASEVGRWAGESAGLLEKANPGFVERIGGGLRGRRLTRGNEFGNQLAGYGTIGGGLVGANMLLSNRKQSADMSKVAVPGAITKQVNRFGRWARKQGLFNNKDYGQAFGQAYRGVRRGAKALDANKGWAAAGLAGAGGLALGGKALKGWVGGKVRRAGMYGGGALLGAGGLGYMAGRGSD